MEDEVVEAIGRHLNLLEVTDGQREVTEVTNRQWHVVEFTGK